MKNRTSILFLSFLALVAILAGSVSEAAAGCCQLGRGDGGRADAQVESDSVDFPFPFPIPFPKRGCFATDDAEVCEALGGSHYQLGFCAEGVCQATAAVASGDAWMLDEPSSCSAENAGMTTVSTD